MKILQSIGDLILLSVFLFNIGMWMWNGFRLPRYVHWIALVAFLLGGMTSYEVFTLGNSVVSTLWIPFLGAGIVYVVFILHGAGLPKDKIKNFRNVDRGEETDKGSTYEH